MEGDNLGLFQLPLALLRHKEAWILRIVLHGMTQRGALSYLALLYPMRQPNLLINAAAYTQVDDAEVQPDLAMAVNAHAAGLLGGGAGGGGGGGGAGSFAVPFWAIQLNGGNGGEGGRGGGMGMRPEKILSALGISGLQHAAFGLRDLKS